VASGSAAAPAPGSADAARAVLSSWLHQVLGERADAIVIDNGSGLSRQQRLSAQSLAALLQYAWHSAVMPELVSSLPLVGQDGTLRRRRVAGGAAHLKTGSLRDVNGLAGYVLGADGRRRVLVAIIHHPNAGAASDALDQIVQWTMRAPGAGRRR
jgi:D-alanyl-D-alanine carboxypeptidase/D-alanyl-D-alanine-endopeptidase (penicillin-binding protein 4)